jgi:tetratricopeptide (TPR) repeat protein
MYKIKIIFVSLFITCSLSFVGCASSNFSEPIMQEAIPAVSPEPTNKVQNSSLDGQTFYYLLLSELLALRQDPDQSYLLLVKAAQKTGDQDLLEKALVIAVQSNVLTAAAEVLKIWLEKHPDSDIPILLAINLLQGKTTDLDTLVQNYLESHPESPLYIYYIEKLVSLQRTPEATYISNHLLSTKPNIAMYWLLQGIIAKAQGNWAITDQSLVRYLHLSDTTQPDKNLPQIYLFLLEANIKQNKSLQIRHWLGKLNGIQLSIDQIEQGLQLTIESKHFDLAQQILLHQERGMTTKQKVLAYVYLYSASQQLEKAYQVLQENLAYTIETQDTDLLYNQAMVAEQLGRFVEAENLLQQLIIMHPNYANAYNALGYIWTDKNIRLDEARLYIDKALSLDPDSAHILDSKGWLLFRINDLVGAQKYLQKAYAIEPHEEIATHYGEVLWHMGKRKQALQIWGNVLNTNPDYPLLRETFRRLGIVIGH